MTKTVTETAPTAPTAATVDEYRVPGAGVYFKSPTGKIVCGLNTSLAGCQVETQVIPPHAACSGGTVPVADMMKGYYSENRAAFQASCFSQGVFFMSEHQKVLPYGRTLTANGITCLSESTGVTCRRGDRGFFVSVQAFRQW